MKFETAFNISDVGYGFCHVTGSIRKLTIGKISVEYTGSTSIAMPHENAKVLSYSGGSYVPSNYGPQEEAYKEVYMCYETGIGSGSLFTLNEHIFVNKDDCLKANEVRLQVIAKEKAEREAYRAEKKARDNQYIIDAYDRLQAELLALGLEKPHGQ